MELFEFDEKIKDNKVGELGLNLFSFDKIIGTDEAGRGPVVGRVYAAAVCFNNNVDEKLFLKLNDSKKLTEKTRDELFVLIKENSIWSIKYSEVDEIEKINILQASLLSMKKAIIEVQNKLKTKNVLCLVDGNRLIKFDMAQKTIVKGDSKSASIAAASILAKVERDNYMKKLNMEFPQYKWGKNKGYLTKEHIEAIKKFGITKYHRKTFLKNYL
ncbi:MAG: ribonuclease HII [Cyanobacteria bacterium SIG30]|nr:ribonuclease HII [Cyanobacteria bacterium SIG30]